MSISGKSFSLLSSVITSAAAASKVCGPRRPSAADSPWQRRSMHTTWIEKTTIGVLIGHRQGQARAKRGRSTLAAGPDPGTCRALPGAPLIGHFTLPIGAPRDAPNEPRGRQAPQAALRQPRR